MGILLDANNISTFPLRNHGFDPHEYLNGVPGERVKRKFTLPGTRKFTKYTSWIRTTIQ